MFSFASMDRFELAWAAGFFDGEGWAALARFGRGEQRRPQARINQAGLHGVPEVLLRFQRAVLGLGRIGGPHVQQDRQDLYHWEVSSVHDVELLHHLLLPWLGQVKVGQLANALGRPAARARSTSPSAEWRAWAAGFFDGEGSTYLAKHQTHDGYVIGEIAVTQSGNSGPPEVLERLVAVVGRGRINGPYAQLGATKDVYRVKVTAQVDLRPFIGALRPWLGTVKRTQADAVLATLASQSRLPRGNPAWGNNKTYCVRGHEYTTARIRPFKPRKGGSEPRPNSGCLACLREYARRRHAERKERPAVDDDHRSISESVLSYLLK